MKHLVRLGIMCLARKTFDFLEAKKLYEKILSELKELDFVALWSSPL